MELADKDDDVVDAMRINIQHNTVYIAAVLSLRFGKKVPCAMVVDCDPTLHGTRYRWCEKHCIPLWISCSKVELMMFT